MYPSLSRPQQPIHGHNTFSLYAHPQHDIKAQIDHAIKNRVETSGISVHLKQGSKGHNVSSLSYISKRSFVPITSGSTACPTPSKSNLSERSYSFIPSL